MLHAHGPGGLRGHGGAPRRRPLSATAPARARAYRARLARRQASPGRRSSSRPTWASRSPSPRPSGWDHHAAEGGARASSRNRLRDFGSSLAAFHRDLGTARRRRRRGHADRVRPHRARERQPRHRPRPRQRGASSWAAACAADACTDAGRGSRPSELYEGRDLAVTTDFRDLLGELLTRHLGASDLRAVFPGHALRSRALPGRDARVVVATRRRTSSRSVTTARRLSSRRRTSASSRRDERCSPDVLGVAERECAAAPATVAPPCGFGLPAVNLVSRVNRTSYDDGRRTAASCGSSIALKAVEASAAMALFQQGGPSTCGTGKGHGARRLSR